MRTPVYIKMDASDPLLLSEGVCHQLGIITYPNVGADPPRTPGTSPRAHVPAVRVKLIQSVRLPPMHSIVVPVQLDGDTSAPEPALLEPLRDHTSTETLHFADSVVHFDERGCCNMLIVNPTGFTRRLEEGTIVGKASEAQCIQAGDCVGGRVGEVNKGVGGQDGTAGGMVVVGRGVGGKVVEVNDGIGEPSQVDSNDPNDLYDTNGSNNPSDSINVTVADTLIVRHVGASPAERKWMMGGLLLCWQDKDRLRRLLLDHQEAFALEDGERGETDLVQMTIETGDAVPRRQPVRRMPFAVRLEVARQLDEMQSRGVIQPSSSPWASPVVLVRKKDGSLRFCIDYRHLNLVTKPDVFPLPRMDDLLDQLGQSKFFSTLDLASGYWQVKVHPDAREKTAFITHQGLYEFNVMPFGLRNAPAVFQRLMQSVLAGLNPPAGPDFVSVYLDDVIVFSRTLDDHLQHLSLVINRLSQAGLKLKPSKCHFISQEVQYLGHILTPQGMQPNPDRIAAVRDYPVPSL